MTCNHEYVYILVQDVNNVPARVNGDKLDIDEANITPMDRKILDIECSDCQKVLDISDYDTRN